MKAAALAVSLVLHVGALLAVPNEPQDGASTGAVEPSTQTSMIASHVPSCACDLEIAACPPAQERR
jgi:hypothetical protein